MTKRDARTRLALGACAGLTPRRASCQRPRPGNRDRHGGIGAAAQSHPSGEIGGYRLPFSPGI